MRMWNVDVEYMCNQHILGEHVEMHMFVGALERKKSFKGFVEKGFVEIHNIRKRHSELEIEMIKRGMNHKSPIHRMKFVRLGKVDPEKSMVDLLKRCKNCRTNFKFKSKKYKEVK
ncbi:MAG: pyrimidine dimer DNA glycosylase/endonuclease V [Nanoarchaeota archaeon]|nr:pyrimidine dimer DNA glycosylase/endonuclease V [Nanoarchaeota archaeon]